jgi:hypothetical protein
MEALSSLFKWSSLKCLYRLDSRLSQLETAVAAKVNAPSPVYKFSRVTRGSSVVKSVSFVFTVLVAQTQFTALVNPLNAELNLICHLLALLGVHNFLHVSRIRVKDDARYTPGEISPLDKSLSP